MPTDETPRRIRVDLMVPAELAIVRAVRAVEEAGADPLLTDAVILLGQAKDKVADWVDSRPPPPDPPPVDRSQQCLTDGSPVTEGHREIDPRTGQQRGYVVLTPAERAKGFVRPVRRSYRHVGARPGGPLRDLTAKEAERYAECHYVGFEEYPPERSPVTGRYWTKEQLASGCGSVTTMGLALAETYARDPGFYSGTFCSRCAKHLPVAEFVWEGTDEVVGS